MANAYLLGGRAYRSAAQQTTFQHDAYLMALLRRHKLVEVIEADGDLLGAILASGEAAELLSALLVEDGKAWNPTDAKANVGYFNALTDQESKAQLTDALILLLADFFAPGGSSSTASPTSSTRRPRRKTASRGSRVPVPAPTPQTATENGPTSSPPSPSDALSA